MTVSLAAAIALVALALAACGTKKPVHRATATAVACSPIPIPVDTPATCTVTVTGAEAHGARQQAPAGVVAFSPVGGGGTAHETTCVPTGTGPTVSCNVTYTPTGQPGRQTLQVTYRGDRRNAPSHADQVVTITTRLTTTTLACLGTSLSIGVATSCTVTVADADAGTRTAPTGLVALSSHPRGAATPRGGCRLHSKGTTASCRFRFAPSGTAAQDAVTAVYRGDALHSASRQTLQLATRKLSVAIAVTCTPASIAIAATSTCTAAVSDTGKVKTPLPTGTITFSLKPGRGSFTPATSCTLAAAGTGAGCHVTYKPPSTAGARTITAAYAGDRAHGKRHTTATVTVVKRRVSAKLACAKPANATGRAVTCTVTVSDAGTSATATAPSGAVTFSSTTGGSFSAGGRCTLKASGTGASCQLTYTPRRNATKYSVTAAYPGDAKHASTQVTVSS